MEEARIKMVGPWFASIPREAIENGNSYSCQIADENGKSYYRLIVEKGYSRRPPLTSAPAEDILINMIPVNEPWELKVVSEI